MSSSHLAQHITCTGKTIIDLAIEMAATAHRKQNRKGTSIPYIVHPYAVGFLLMQAGHGQPLVIAGILHDLLEDTDVTLDEIRSRFGNQVAEIVEGCSEPGHGTKDWKDRKQHTIEYLKTAPREVRIVSCADKLHNIRAIAQDHKEHGDALWKRFNADREKQRWYYMGLADSLCGDEHRMNESPLYGQFRYEVDCLFVFRP